MMRRIPQDEIEEWSAALIAQIEDCIEHGQFEAALLLQVDVIAQVLVASSVTDTFQRFSSQFLAVESAMAMRESIMTEWAMTITAEGLEDATASQN